MYRIMIIPARSANPVGLFFTSRETAQIAQKNIHDVQSGKVDVEVLTAKDDMGHVVTMHRDNIEYALFIDVDVQPEQMRPTASAAHPSKSDIIMP